MTAANAVYQDLFHRIMRGAIRPGTLMTEELWARHFKVSRTPVREAFRRLAQDGLIARDARSLHITQPSPARIDEVYRIMGVLEGFACSETARRRSKGLLQTLKRFSSEMRTAVQRSNADQAIRLNSRFHAAIIRGAQNSALVESIDRFNAVMLHYRNIGMRIPGRLIASVAEHDAIVKAIETRNAPTAEITMRHHLEQGRRALSAVFDAASMVAGAERAMPADRLRWPGRDKRRGR